MNRYTVYIPNCRPQSEQKLFAPSSFAARKAYVSQRNAKAGDTTLEITDVCAIRDNGGL